MLFHYIYLFSINDYIHIPVKRRENFCCDRKSVVRMFKKCCSKNWFDLYSEKLWLYAVYKFRDTKLHSTTIQLQPRNMYGVCTVHTPPQYAEENTFDFRHLALSMFLLKQLNLNIQLLSYICNINEIIQQLSLSLSMSW